MTPVTTRFNISCLLLIALVVALAYSPRVVFRDSVNVDAASYLSHALTIGLDFDLDYTNEPVMDHWYNTTTGMPAHPIGPGLLAAPMVALFSIPDRIGSAPVLSDRENFQFSWAYFGFVFASVFYVLLGTWLYTRVAIAVSPQLDLRWVMLLSVSFGMLYYALQSAEMPHTFQFFAFALALWGSVNAWIATVKGQSAFPVIAWAGVGMVLAHLVRPADFNVFVLPPLVAVVLSLHPRWGASDGSVWRRFVTGYAALLLGVFALLAFVNYSLYGSAFPTPAQMYGKFMPMSEVFTEGSVSGPLRAITRSVGLIGTSFLVLFSSEFGIFYTAPIFVFGCVMLLGLCVDRFRTDRGRRLLAAVLVFVFVGVPATVVIYWQGTADNYGFRYLFSIYPAAFLGFALWHQRMWEPGRTPPRWATATIWGLGVLSLFAIASQWFWGTSDKLHYVSGINVFGVGTQYGAKGYVTSLLSALVEPNAWISMIAHRFPGFVGAAGLEVFGVDLAGLGAQLGIPADRLAAGIARYVGMPPVALLQASLLYLTAVLGGWWIACASYRPQPRPKTA